MSLSEDIEPKRKKIRIVCISDTHNHGPPSGFQLPKGDILIHAGDLTNRGTYAELERAAAWLEKAEFPGAKVVVAGNHELTLDPSYTPRPGSSWAVEPEERQRCRELISNIPGVTYLEHSSTTIQLPEHGTTVKVFGSPFSPADPSKSEGERTEGEQADGEQAGGRGRGSDCWAFQYSSSQAEELWNAIPNDTDILITHTPAAGHCDISKYWSRGGCPALLNRVWDVRPALHVFGHCHEGRGAEVVRWGDTSHPADTEQREKGRSKGSDGGVEVESVRPWTDPGANSKKLSLLDLTGSKGGQRLERGRETAVVNASIMSKSWERRGAKEMRKPIVVAVIL